MITKYLTKSFYINLCIVFSIYILDRISKIYIIYLDKQILESNIFESAFLNITLIWNKGIAFGLFSFDEIYFYNLLSIIIAVVIVALLVMAVKTIGFRRYYLFMIIGGALGNLHDRIFSFAVPDFIDFHIGTFHWFIFNVSDIFISLGVIGMIISELINDKANDKV
jgi:signal peptidase II